MATFEINGKEYELKLTFKAVAYLNGIVEGGSLGLIGKALQGDVEIFPHIIFAGLFHTGENIPLKDIEKAVDEAVSGEKLSFNDIYRISNELITKSFFYKETFQRVVSQQPEGKKVLEQLEQIFG